MPGERFIELRWNRERRESEQRRQVARRIETLAVSDLAIEWKRRSEIRIDATRTLGAAGRHAQQPTVVEKLLLRLQRIQAGLFDAHQLDGRHQMPPKRR